MQNKLKGITVTWLRTIHWLILTAPVSLTTIAGLSPSVVMAQLPTVMADSSSLEVERETMPANYAQLAASPAGELPIAPKQPIEQLSAEAVPIAEPGIPTLAQVPTYSTDANLLSPGGKEILAQETPATPEPTTPVPQRPATTGLGTNQLWTLSAELVLLSRDMKGVTTTIDTDSNRSFGTQNLSFGLTPGAKLTAGYYFSPSSSLEASVLAFNSHTSSSAITATFAPPVPGGESLLPAFDPIGLSPVEDYTAAYQNRIRYNSDLTNIEVNYRQTVTPNTDPLQVSLLAGFRYVKVGEGFELLSTDEDPARVGGNGPHTGRYTINANNDLFGLQIGGDINAQVSPAFTVGLKLRAGVFLNSSGQNSSLLNNDGDSTSGQLPIAQSIFTGSNSGTVVSPLVELGLTAAVDLSPSVTLTGGLTMLYVDNLALAPQQFARDANFATSLSRLERTSAFYFGPSIGLLVRL